MRVLTRFLVPVCLAGLAQGAAVKSAETKARETLRALPMRFEPNAGQWDRQVRFAARAGGYTLALMDREAVLSLGERRIAMSLRGANHKPVVEGAGLLPARASYFVGNWRAGWRTGVPQYTRVLYRGVYPGIDVAYYGNGSQLEYDFVLRPGADPSRIRIHFRGADGVTVTPEGDLAVEAGGSRIVQRRPVVYQQDAAGVRHEVAAAYRMLDNRTAAVEVGKFDRSRTLTIDPVLEYAALMGGLTADAVTAVKIDKDGFVWVAGYISDGGITAKGNPFNDAYLGGKDIFLPKIDPNASGPDSLLYFTYIGGSGNDIPTDMTLDASGNVYLCGSTNSTDFPLGGWAYQPTLSSTTDSTTGAATTALDAFALKLRPNVAGTDALAWSTYLGGTSDDEARGIAVDAAGNVYIAGISKSSDFPLTSDSAFQVTLWGPQDGFIAEFNPNLADAPSTLLYSTLIGGESYDDISSIAVAPDGSVYVGGSTTSTQFPWAGNPYSASLLGGQNLWIGRVDTSQSGPDSIPYASYFGGSAAEELRNLAVDARGRVWLTGVTLSADYPVTFGAFQPDMPGTAGVGFVTCLDFSPSRPAFVAYSTFLGGSGGDAGYSIVPDAAGGVWVTGYTLSTDFPVTKDAILGTYPGGNNIFVTKLDTTKSGSRALAYSTYLGQTSIQVGVAIALGADGTVAIGGQTGRPGITATPNSFRGDYGGGLSDGFLAVLKP